MLQGVDINQVKQYNDSLKQYKDKASKLNAEIEYTNKEIDALCAELSAELGVKVTRDNIQQVYEEQVNKINSTLQSGNAVLAKIASEERAASTMQSAPAQSVPVQPSQPVQQTPVAPTMASAPVMSTASIPAMESQPVAGSVFGTAQQAQNPLPTMFNIGS